LAFLHPQQQAEDAEKVGHRIVGLDLGGNWTHPAGMLQLQTPNGLSAEVPEAASEDHSPHFLATQEREIRAYFDEHGYVVVTGLIPKLDTSATRGHWLREVRPFRGKMYRQATAKLERHRVNDAGWVMNPILNIQSLDPRHFGGLREYVRRWIFGAEPLCRLFRALLGDAPKIIQSMYFEGNSATWEHQDSYYLDSEHIGSMVGAWVALEDIAPRAGRFFVVPGSHRLKRLEHSASNNVATAHDAYIASVVQQMRESGAEVRAPAMREGDVLFWNSLTIHGSLDSQDREHSRSSITCHAIPAGDRMIQYHSRIRDVPGEELNGVRIHAPKDLARLRNRAVRAAEAIAPAPFHALKRAAITALVR
jgi:phytanoyl-CoA hydroxylase